MRKYVRETTLNEKFKGTWVAEGLVDEATMRGIGKSHKVKDLTVELIEADTRADEWLAEAKKTENMALNMKAPPIVLGKYYKDFCSSRIAAYKDYKSIGIKELVKNEEKRFEKKLHLQKEAQKQEIKPSKMLKFAQKTEKEEIWKQIIPEKLLNEIKRRE